MIPVEVAIACLTVLAGLAAGVAVWGAYALVVHLTRRGRHARSSRWQKRLYVDTEETR